jgi:8-hydroxy-5-deazaflavin:NADPH oxidoreductase
MGAGLAVLLTEAGYEVKTSRRNPERGEDPGPDGVVTVTSFEEAARFGDIVVLAVPHAGVVQVAASVADLIAGKVLVDITNSVVYEDGRTRSGLAGVSNGSWVAERFPGARVTRAYSHIQDEMLVSRARRQPGNWAVAVAGDDEDAVQATCTLVEATHYVPVLVGTLEQSVVIDPGGPVFPHMMTPADLGDVLDAAKATLATP